MYSWASGSTHAGAPRPVRSVMSLWSRGAQRYLNPSKTSPRRRQSTYTAKWQYVDTSEIQRRCCHWCLYEVHLTSLSCRRWTRETESCCRCWICCCSVCHQLFQCSDIYDVGVKVCLGLPVFVSHHERDPLSLEILVLPFWYWLLNVCVTQEKR